MRPRHGDGGEERHAAQRHASVTGFATATGPPTVGPVQGGNAGGYDAFVADLGPSGSSLVFSTYLGGSRDDYGWAIALDGAGDVYVAGWTASPDFPTLDAPQSKYGGGAYDAFVAELAQANPGIPGPERLVYSTYLGGGGDDHPYGIAVDSGGNAYVAGATASGDFPTLSAFQAGYQGGAEDAFVAKADPDCFAGGCNDNPLPPVPTSTTSYYMKTVSVGTLQAMGANNANKSGVIVLDFGAQASQNGVDGTLYPGQNTVFFSDTQIISAAEAFIQSYVTHSSRGFIRISISTNNSGLVSYSEGQIWANLVNAVGTYVSSMQGYGQRIAVYGGSDIEPGYRSGADSFQWASGYDSVSGYDFYNYGSCDGCRTGDHYGSTILNYPGTSWTAGGPAYQWLENDLYEVAGGIPSALALPEIFREDGTQANQWEETELYAAQNFPGNLVEFDGSLTKHQACVDVGDPCKDQDNTPAQGWQQLWCAVNSGSAAVVSGGASCASWNSDANHTAQVVPFSSDIRWNDQ